MSSAKDTSQVNATEDAIEIAAAHNSIDSMAPLRPRRILGFLITAAMVALAAWFGQKMWHAYMDTPWTRDGTVRAYVVTIAPEVSGRVIALPLADNQFVHKGDLLIAIDQTDYRLAITLAEAAVQQAEANAQNAQREAARRERLRELASSVEEQQIYQTQALATQALLRQARANLEQARVNLKRTEIRSPVDGWVTNLLTQLGDYATVGQSAVSVVDAGSFWIDAYVEETHLASIREGDPARIKLMSYRPVLQGRVVSVARGIHVANAQPNPQGLAEVNPIFTWVRLAQRIPVRVSIDAVPAGVTLVAGMTATVQIEPQHARPLTP